MSEIYTIMRCIPICMQGITHGCKHCLCICCCLLRINRLLLASSTEFSATGPQRLAKAVIPTLSKRICMHLCKNGQKGQLLMVEDFGCEVSRAL